MTKILYLIYGLEPAGAERLLFSLVSKLDRDKYFPVVCALKHGGSLVKEFQENNIKVFVLKKKGKFDFTVIKKIINIIRNEKIDMIHSHNFSANLWGRIGGKLGKISRIITTEHTLAIHKNWFQKRADLFLSKFTDCIITVSESVHDSLIEQVGLSAEKIKTIYNGIDLDNFRNLRSPNEVRKELDLNKGYPIVGIVGRLVPAKGHIYFIRAAQGVVRVFPNAKFLIIGDGELRGELNELTIKRGLKDAIKYLGYREDRLDIINIFDVAVLSSIREGLPVTLLEYMALKKPIVVTNVGGMSEVIENGVSGYVVPQKDANNLAKKIIRILEDKRLSMDLGQNAYECVIKHFTEEIMINKTQALYDQIMNIK